MNNFPIDVCQAVHAHHGTCDNLGEVVRAGNMGWLTNGRFDPKIGTLGETYIDFDGQLMNEYLPWLVDVHSTAHPDSDVAACGDFTELDL